MATDNLNEGHRKRLRERFLGSTLKGFHDYEAVELLLTYAIPRRDVKPIAKELIKRFGDFKGVFEASFQDLTAVPGVGSKAAAIIVMPRYAARVYLSERSRAKSIVRCPDDAVKFVELCEGDFDCEKLYAMYLSTKNEVLGLELLHQGGMDMNVFKPRDVIEKAFKHNARSVIFIHRTTEDFAFPSGFNVKLCRELEDAASAVEIIVHDHILLARESHMSARESGVIAPPEKG